MGVNNDDEKKYHLGVVGNFDVLSRVVEKERSIPTWEPTFLLLVEFCQIAT
jgi:hypothetical protein